MYVQLLYKLTCGGMQNAASLLVVILVSNNIINLLNAALCWSILALVELMMFAY